MFKHVRLTLPLRKARAATNSFGGMALLSVSSVLIAPDTGDGIERPESMVAINKYNQNFCLQETFLPYEFSARTMNIYVVAGLSSLICNESQAKKLELKTVCCRKQKSSWGRDD